ARAARAVADLAQRPREPKVTEDMITSGRWAARMVEHVAPYTDDFAALLGRALPPNHPHLSGASVSERLEAALRALDSTALDLQRRIPKLAQYQRLPSIEDLNSA